MGQRTLQGRGANVVIFTVRVIGVASFCYIWGDMYFNNYQPPVFLFMVLSVLTALKMVDGIVKELTKK